MNILKLICLKEITLLNDEDITIDLSMARPAKNLGNSMGKKNNSSVFLSQTTKTKDLPVKNMKRMSRFGNDKPKKSGRKGNKKKTKRKIHTKKKKSPFNKFLEKSDIIEIAIRAPNIPDEEEMEIITLLYEHLATPTSETVNLYKLLIYYEQLQTFELVLEYRAKHNFTKDKANF